MTIKKIGVFIATAGLITALVIGCGSSNTNNNDDNSTLESEGFTGSAFSFILKGLATGMLSETGGDVMGNFLSLLGWGDSGNSEEEQTLKSIDSTLTVISGELVTIESTLLRIIEEIDIVEHEIKGVVDWPREAIDFITTAHQDLNSSGYYYLDGTLHRYKPGEGNQTDIKNMASTFLNTYILKDRVTSIYNAIKGNPTPLLSNYIGEVIDKLDYNDARLPEQYQGFEAYTSQLLNNQIMGVNEVIEAIKILDGNSSAELYLNQTYMPMLMEEIDNMDNPTSFIYNAVSLVLRDAPLYDPFLPTSAESILKRAEFYRLLMTGEDHKKFGLHIFRISTADMKKSPDYMYVSKTGGPGPGLDVKCGLSSRHTVKGRAYDFWVDQTVKQSKDYNVAEYYCLVPIGKYSVYDDYSDSDSDTITPLGYAEVSQYDTNYDLNSSGTISYGFGLVTKNIANRFTESSDKWTIDKPSSENYNSWTSGSANDWPIKAHADSDNTYNEESNAYIELDGHFYYDKDEEERTMYIDYHVKFHTQADAPFDINTGGGDAYSYYYVGVYDHNTGRYASDSCKNRTYYRLHASSDHKYSEDHEVSEKCSFTAIPGHHYHVYFKVVANTTGNDETVAESILETVYRVYVLFDD